LRRAGALGSDSRSAHLQPRTVRIEGSWARRSADSPRRCGLRLPGPRDPAGSAPRPPAGLPENSFAFNRALLAAIYLTFAAIGFIGFLFAFGEWDRPVILFGVEIPQLIGEGDAVRKPFGYLHSALGFYYMMLATIWLAYGVFQHLRYRVGLARLLPGIRV